MFKGTSNFHEFFRWDFVTNDYKFMARECDERMFAHGGASLFVDNLMWRRLYREAFEQRLGNASRENVSRLVLTGHSLGGMYASLLLYKLRASAVNETRTWSQSPMSEGASRLLRSVRCATFGSQWLSA